jgi:hypothetical protein
MSVPTDSRNSAASDARLELRTGEPVAQRDPIKFSEREMPWPRSRTVTRDGYGALTVSVIISRYLRRII